jgi:hypothetical protein
MAKDIEGMSIVDYMLRVQMLEDVIRTMLLSADCSWEERNEGHDWREACEFARKALESRRWE